MTNTPVLRYYNLEEEVTLQCDASQSGLGAALMQNGQPVAYASRALTSAETRYAQIEKELLAVVFACQRFDAYVYGRANVNVESDHKPLKIIMRKTLDAAPKRLQRMLLALQKYDINLRYKRGETMFLADMLSRAYLPEVNVCDVARECETLDHRSTLPVTKERWQQLQFASEHDLVLQKLRDIILQGWPANKVDVPECVRPYFDSRDELTVQDALVFKRDLLVVPTSMRRELLAVAHSTHIGIEGCIRRMRDTLYWPRMTTEVREYVSRCEICLAHRDSPGKEPIIQHEIIARPWSKVGADLCDSNGRTLLVMCDYYSNFIEVAHLKSTTSRCVIREMSEVFARFGTSPAAAQRLMGRRCKTLLPVAGTLLLPRHSTESETRGLLGMKRRQQYYANQHTKPLTPIESGDTVRMRLPGKKRWSLGTCIRQVAPRSYNVNVDAATYRRNRRQLLCAGEFPVRDPLEYNGSSRDDPPTTDDPGVVSTDPVLRDDPVSGHDDPIGGQEPVPTVVTGPMRSSRETRRPSRLSDYV